MSTEQSESAHTAITAPQVETKAAPAADVTQQATTPSETTQRVKNPSVWPPKKWLPKERGWPGKHRRKRPRLGAEKKEAKAATAAPEPTPTTEGENPKSGGLSANQWIATGGICVSLLGIYYKREELKATANAPLDKIRSPRLSPAPHPRVSSQNLLARHGQEY